MDRQAFRRLDLLRLAEAKALLENGHYHGAYYLCGYAVECGLKACLAKRTKQFAYPPEPDVVRRVYYSHHLPALLEAIGDLLASELRKHPLWPQVAEWSVNARYRLEANRSSARELIEAVAHRRRGVLKWIRRYW